MSLFRHRLVSYYVTPEEHYNSKSKHNSNYNVTYRHSMIGRKANEKSQRNHTLPLYSFNVVVRKIVRFTCRGYADDWAVGSW